MATGVSALNRAFNLVPKRAEAQESEELRETFVDSGVAAALESVDHQVLYGRRGTGKTHAFRYLQTVVGERGDIGFYADLRTIGSPEGLFAGEEVPATQRAARLLVDLLAQFHDALLDAALNDDELITKVGFVNKLDAFLASITTVRVAGEIEVSKEGEKTVGDRTGAAIDLQLGTQPSLKAGLSTEGTEARRDVMRETRRGTERLSLAAPRRVEQRPTGHTALPRRVPGPLRSASAPKTNRQDRCD